MSDTIANKALRVLLLTNGLILVAGAMLAPIYALFVDEIGGDLMDASLAGAAFALAAAITSLVSGRFSDNMREGEYVVVFGYVLVGTGFLLLTQVGSIWSLFAIQALIGIGEAIYSPAYDALYSKHLSTSKEGAQWSLWESMNYISIVIGAIVGGFIAQSFGFDQLFIVMSLLCFGSALYTFLLPRKML